MWPWTALIIVAVGGLLVLLWRLVRPAPRLRVGERGILDRDLGWGWIPWEEIEGGYPPSADQGESIRLRLRVTDRLARVLRRRRRLPTTAPLEEQIEVRFDLTGSGLSAVELLQQVIARRTDPDRGSRLETRRFRDV